MSKYLYALHHQVFKDYLRSKMTTKTKTLVLKVVSVQSTHSEIVNRTGKFVGCWTNVIQNETKKMLVSESTFQNGT